MPEFHHVHPFLISSSLRSSSPESGEVKRFRHVDVCSPSLVRSNSAFLKLFHVLFTSSPLSGNHCHLTWVYSSNFATSSMATLRRHLLAFLSASTTYCCLSTWQPCLYLIFLCLLCRPSNRLPHFEYRRVLPTLCSFFFPLFGFVIMSECPLNCASRVIPLIANDMKAMMPRNAPAGFRPSNVLWCRLCF